ncbi:uncharacterized protein [Temnothorax nylanderi]|uniref:uncharacterized protein n=1 Tax=Temnothorax nylanderi TaxID=102681 RepID=UPI003A844FFC
MSDNKKMESKPCENDKDCDDLDYHCYDKRCVDSRHICSRYNRIKSEVKTIDGPKCGPCMTGYSKEILANGKEGEICQKNVTDTKPYYVGSTMDNTTNITKLTLMIIFPILVVFLTIYLLMWLMRFIRKKGYCNRRNFFTLNNAANTELAITEVATTNTNDELTSVSLEEQRLFTELAKEKCCDNNYRRTVNNEYQTARVCTPPQYQVTPLRICAIVASAPIVSSSGNNVPGANVPNEGYIVAQLQNDIPDNQSTTQTTITGLPEVNIEQEDNARNTTLLQTYSSDSDTDPESNEKNNAEKKSDIIINQALSNTINMNVNVIH